MDRPDPEPFDGREPPEPIAALRAIAPARLPEALGLVCTCSDCIDTETLARLEGGWAAALSARDVWGWWGAAFAFFGDGSVIGGASEERASDHRDEAMVFFAKQVEALADEAMVGPTRSERPLVVPPDMAARRFLATRLRESFTPREREIVDAALIFAAETAWTRGSPLLLECLDHLGSFGDGLPALLDRVTAAPLKVQAGFWGRVLGGRLGTPAAVAGRDRKSVV